MSDEIEEKILSMYGLGMSYRDISSHIEEIYKVITGQKVGLHS